MIGLRMEQRNKGSREVDACTWNPCPPMAFLDQWFRFTVFGQFLGPNHLYCSLAPADNTKWYINIYIYLCIHAHAHAPHKKRSTRIKDIDAASRCIIYCGSHRNGAKSLTASSRLHVDIAHVPCLAYGSIITNSISKMIKIQRIFIT